MNKEDLQKRIKEAMIAKDEQALSVLRSLSSAMHNREIELRTEEKELDEQEIMNVFRKELKKRKEAAQLYKDADDKERAEQEEKEAEFIEQFLPAGLSEQEVEAIVSEVVGSLSDEEKNFGVVMKKVMEKTDGRADGKVVSELVKKQLG